MQWEYKVQSYPYKMKIYTEFNLATWLRLAKFTELNIAKFDLKILAI